MFLSYLKIVLRIIRRQKVYALINIAGLAIGLTVSLLISIWVFDELSFDRFHENSARIHRVYVDFVAGTHMTLALSMPEFAAAAKHELPEVVNAARISRPGRTHVRYEDKEFFENYVCYADSSIFDIFTFPFTAGNSQTALPAPYSAVITEDTAEKYFGGDNPLGKTIKLGENKDYVVNGVVKNVPFNSHFRFHIVLSFETLYSENREDMENWLNIQYYTYLLLAERTDFKALERKFPTLIDKYMGEALKSIGGSCDLYLQPLTGIHLFSDIGGEIAEQGDITYIYLFTGIAMFVLLLACINFINLTTARSASRAREIGMRKALGSSRKTLILQFLGESMLYSLFSFLLASAVTEMLTPAFESLIGRPLKMNAADTPLFGIGLLVLAVLVGILAGSYPAFYLSSFRPVRVLKSGFSGGPSKSRFRNVLVVFQFAVSIVLIIGTLTVYQQIGYMKSKSLGFEKEQVVVIPGAAGLLKRMSFQTVREELNSVPGVVNTAGSALVPTRGIQNAIFYPEGFSRKQPQKLTRLDLEPNYIPVMNMEIAAGRNFSEEMAADPEQSLLINETLAEMFGWENPIGKTFSFWSSPGNEEVVITKKVIGVVKDYHFASLHHKIDPVVLAYDPDRIRYLSLKIAPSNISQTISSLEKKWKELDSQRPFDYFFLDTAFDGQYRGEERIVNLSLFFSVLAVLIGCLGLFGLAAYMAERRTREIGIRKVLGASSTGIVKMISKEFILLVTAANALAWPAAYAGLGLWFQNYPYRTGVSGLVMGAAGGVALATALLTVSFQAVKAARANPADALRYE